MGTHTTLLGYRELWRIVFYENYIDESISLVHWRVAMAFDFSKNARLLMCTLKILIQFSPLFFVRQC